MMNLHTVSLIRCWIKRMIQLCLLLQLHSEEPGDFGGRDLVIGPENGGVTVLAGTYKNVGAFVISSNVTIRVRPFNGDFDHSGHFSVYANTVQVFGVIDASGSGWGGGGGGGGGGGAPGALENAKGGVSGPGAADTGPPTPGYVSGNGGVGGSGGLGGGDDDAPTGAGASGKGGAGGNDAPVEDPFKKLGKPGKPGSHGGYRGPESNADTSAIGNPLDESVWMGAGGGGGGGGGGGFPTRGQPADGTEVGGGGGGGSGGGGGRGGGIVRLVASDFIYVAPQTTPSISTRGRWGNNGAPGAPGEEGIMPAFLGGIGGNGGDSGESESRGRGGLGGDGVAGGFKGGDGGDGGGGAGGGILIRAPIVNLSGEVNAAGALGIQNGGTVKVQHGPGGRFNIDRIIAGQTNVTQFSPGRLLNPKVSQKRSAGSLYEVTIIGDEAPPFGYGFSYTTNGASPDNYPEQKGKTLTLFLPGGTELKLLACAPAWESSETVDLQTSDKVWTGAGDQLSWSDPENWSGGSPPSATSDVFIPVAAQDSIIPEGQKFELNTLLCRRKLKIYGSLEFHGNVSIPGLVEILPKASIIARGDTANMDVSLPEILTDATLISYGGKITLQGVSSLRTREIERQIIQAIGPGSLISLPNATEVIGPALPDHRLEITATDGGQILLSGVKTIIASDWGGGLGKRGTRIVSEGLGSEINLTTLINIPRAEDLDTSVLYQIDGGKILLPAEPVDGGLNRYTYLRPAGKDSIWTAEGSPYFFDTDISYEDLKIEAGVQVFGGQNAGIAIRKSLSAIGSEEHPIQFTAMIAGTYWKGLTISGCCSNELAHCNFNSASDHALAIGENVSAKLHKCNFVSNGITLNSGGFDEPSRRPRGGAAILNVGNIDLAECVFSNNFVNASLCAKGAGGAIYCSGRIIMTNCSFQRNSVILDGGGTVNADCSRNASRQGGALYIAGGTIKALHCDFAENSTSHPANASSDIGRFGGGAIEVVGGGSFTAVASTFRGNFTSKPSAGSASAIDSSDGDLNLENCLFYSNIDARSVISTRKLGMTNCTLVSNSIYGNGYIVTSQDSLVNSSIIYNSPHRSITESENTSVQYSIVFGGFVGTRNRDEDPKLDRLTFLPESLSPAIDTGDPSADLEDLAFPPSRGLANNDTGAFGGPGATLWPEFEALRPKITINGISAPFLDVAGDGYCIQLTPTVGTSDLRYRLNTRDSWIRPNDRSSQITDSAPLCVTNRDIRRIWARCLLGDEETFLGANVRLRPVYPLTVDNPGGGKYDVEIAQDPPGMNVPYTSNGILYPSNTTVRLTAVADPGWTFLQWLNPDAVSTSSYIATIDGPTALQLQFGTHVGVVGSEGGGVSGEPIGDRIPYGTLVHLSAAPLPTHYLAQWKLGNQQLLPFRWFPVVEITNRDMVFRAEFDALDQLDGEFALKLEASGGGRIDVKILGNDNLERLPERSTFRSGDRIRLIAVPFLGQRFLGWHGNLEGDSLTNDLEFATSHLEIQAQFGTCSPPSIKTQPTDVAAKLHRTAQFSAVVSGAPFLTLQWQFEPTFQAGEPRDLLGETNEFLTIKSITEADAGYYSLRVVNSCDSFPVSSEKALLTIVPNKPPNISVISPTNRSQFSYGAKPRLTAFATDPDGDIQTVEFLASSTDIGESNLRIPAIGVPGEPGRFEAQNWTPGVGNWRIAASCIDDDAAQAVSKDSSEIYILPTSDVKPVLDVAENVIEGKPLTGFVKKTTESGAGTFRLRALPISAKSPDENGVIDYAFPGRTNALELAFSDSDTSVPFTLDIRDDLLDEGTEEFALVLETFTGTALATNIVRIIDNDQGLASRDGSRLPVDWERLDQGNDHTKVCFDISPPLGRWRFEWETIWHGNNEVVDIPFANQQSETLLIKWANVSGYADPELAEIEIRKGTSFCTNVNYTKSNWNETGGRVSVILDPPNVALWRISGTQDEWLESGRSAPVPQGDHLLEFTMKGAAATSDYLIPAPVIVNVPLLATVTKQVHLSSVTDYALLPQAIGDLESIPDNEIVENGMACVGQIWTEFGWGTAFGVSENVILTAAHLLFGYIDGEYRETRYLYWFPQRSGGQVRSVGETGTAMVMKPLKAAGWLIPPEYERRISEGNEDASYEASKADYAAVYFHEPAIPGVARGHKAALAGGYKVCSPENGFSLNDVHLNRLKVSLIGYPMGGNGSPAQELIAKSFYMHRDVESYLRDNPILKAWPESESKWAPVWQMRVRGLSGTSGGLVAVADPTDPAVFRPVGIFQGDWASQGQGRFRTINQDVVEYILRARSIAEIGGNTCSGDCSYFASSPGGAGNQTAVQVFLTSNITNRSEASRITLTAKTGDVSATNIPFNQRILLKLDTEYQILLNAPPFYETPEPLMFRFSKGAGTIVTNIIFKPGPALVESATLVATSAGHTLQLSVVGSSMALNSALLEEAESLEMGSSMSNSPWNVAIAERSNEGLRLIFSVKLANNSTTRLFRVRLP